MSKTSFQTFTLGLVFLIAVTLTGCGFHLRGQYQMPAELSQLDLEVKTLTPAWQKRIQESLRDYDIKTQVAAPLRLTISSIEEDRRVASYNDRAKAAEYELSVAMHFALLNKANNQILQQKKLISRRTYRFDETTVSAKQEEEDIIREELNIELFNQLLRQLQWTDFTPLRDIPIINSPTPENSSTGEATP